MTSLLRAVAHTSRSNGTMTSLLRAVAHTSRSSSTRMIVRRLQSGSAGRKMPSKVAVAARYTLGTAAVGTGAALAYAYCFDEGAWRTVRVLSSLVPMAIDFQRLSLSTAGLPEEVRRSRFNEYHHKWKDEPLRICLSLRGFYVKVGQICAGFPGDGLPEPYRESLKILQEAVPPQPYSRIKAITEAELGCKIEEIFAEFEGEPIGAASIGQVHRARLHDGTNVVVKVQYPEVEANFRMDFATVLAIFRVVNETLIEPINAFSEGFTSEFDYRLEAENLRSMIDEVLPRCKARGLRVNFPEPFDARHPKLPAALRARGASLCTKRLMVMELCPGSSVTKIGKRLIADFARTQGQGAREFEAEMKRRMMEDPQFLDELLARAVPTRSQLVMYRTYLSVRAGLYNTVALAYNCTLRWLLMPLGVRSSLPYTSAALPPNGPMLMEALYAAHAIEIFEVGAFNADPHAGNVVLDEETETLYLIDYGQLVKISEADRTAFAYLIVGLNESDAEACAASFRSWGVDSTWKKDGVSLRPPPSWTALTSAHINFGGAAGLAYGLRSFEFSSVAEMLGGGLDAIVETHRTPSVMMLTLRCCWCLSGVGDAVGLFGVSPGKMLLPAARAYLQARGLPPRHPDAKPMIPVAAPTLVRRLSSDRKSMV